MAVTLRGVPQRERIEVTGDVQTALKLPFSEESTFYLLFSDGTLIEGHYDEERVYRFKPHTDGAGILTIRREGEHDVIDLAWHVEWVTIAAPEECAALLPPDAEARPTTSGMLGDILGRLRETAH